MGQSVFSAQPRYVHLPGLVHNLLPSFKFLPNLGFFNGRKFQHQNRVQHPLHKISGVDEFPRALFKMMSFPTPSVYQSSKCFFTHGTLTHPEPKQLPSKGKPWATLLAQDFIHKVRFHSIEALIPG